MVIDKDSDNAAAMTRRILPAPMAASIPKSACRTRRYERAAVARLNNGAG
jgi:hypothetical protein